MWGRTYTRRRRAHDVRRATERAISAAAAREEASASGWEDREISFLFIPLSLGEIISRNSLLPSWLGMLAYLSGLRQTIDIKKNITI